MSLVTKLREQLFLREQQEKQQQQQQQAASSRPGRSQPKKPPIKPPTRQRPRVPENVQEENEDQCEYVVPDARFEPQEEYLALNLGESAPTPNNDDQCFYENYNFPEKSAGKKVPATSSKAAVSKQLQSTFQSAPPSASPPDAQELYANDANSSLWTGSLNKDANRRDLEPQEIYENENATDDTPVSQTTRTTRTVPSPPTSRKTSKTTVPSPPTSRKTSTNSVPSPTTSNATRSQVPSPLTTKKATKVPSPPATKKKKVPTATLR